MIVDPPLRTMTQAHYDDLARLSQMPTAAIRALWDAYDGCNCPEGISGEAIHEVLNARGDGAYCSV